MTTTAIKAAITELNATINTLERFFPEDDKGATAALLSSTTARAFLRDALEEAGLDAAQATAATTPATATPKRKTASHLFHHRLFSVQEGIPADDALELASCLLASARDAAFLAGGTATTEEASAMYGAGYLIEMAKAVVDAAVCAIQSEEMAGAQ